MGKAVDQTFTISKIDDERQLVYGEVYIPDVPDSHGDFMTAIEIEKMAYGFLMGGLVSKIDVEHNLEESGSFVVESFIARKGDPDFIEKSWVLGVHITDPEKWAMIKNGELNGFSMFGKGKRTEKVLEIEIPDSGIIKGETRNGGIELHEHKFNIRFSDEGKFLGGETDTVNGHHHRISKGTITDVGGEDGHVHKYSFLEGIV